MLLKGTVNVAKRDVQGMLPDVLLEERFQKKKETIA